MCYSHTPSPKALTHTCSYVPVIIWSVASGRSIFCFGVLSRKISPRTNTTAPLQRPMAICDRSSNTAMHETFDVINHSPQSFASPHLTSPTLASQILVHTATVYFSTLKALMHTGLSFLSSLSKFHIFTVEVSVVCSS